MTVLTAEDQADKDYGHISEKYRAKVAGDLLFHLTPDGHWDAAKFNPLSDYQRHLYALFLKVSGKTAVEVYAAIYVLSTDVTPRARGRYASEVVHSEIVGFPRKDGSLIAVPDQEG